VAELCRRLDGIAPAIELAATRLDAFGVRDLLTLLNDSFGALGQGRRTGPDRHKTLSAMLDWSYQLLPTSMRIVLHRLSIFVGAFSLKSAIAVVSDNDLPSSSIVDAVQSLVAKSMLSAQFDGKSTRYRLLDTTREYARQKLVNAGELDQVARRHSEHFCDMYAQAESHWSHSPDDGWLDEHVRAIDNVRTALSWAFSPQGDSSLGVALTVSSIPAWMHLSSLEECRSCVERALSKADDDPLLDVHRMKLEAALAASAIYTKGMAPQVKVAWTTALALA
jgi:predicted ATPase